MMPEKQGYEIKIETREQLLYTLTEAAEIEHNLMCCYLYAAFSMKSDEGEGLTADQLKAVTRWRRAITSVAVEEMGHLALVSNLMCAIGGAAHFGRPNFPITPGYHPAGMQVLLAPFNRETIQHFVYLERPEGVEEEFGKGFEPQGIYRRSLGEHNHLMPSGQDYETVGELYHAVAQGLRHIAGRDGDEALFVGGTGGQVGPDVVSLPGIQTIANLEDALRAIDTIVEQGEGAPAVHEDGHYQRFVTIRSEYDAILAEAPDFVPARSVARNPVMRQPVTPGDRVWVSDPTAASVMDFANALYGQMLRLLSQAFGRPDRVGEKQVLINTAIDLMYAMVPAAEQLTLLEANDSSATKAGISFATLRPLTALPHGASEWKLLDQRFAEIEKVGATLASIGPRMAASVAAINRISSGFRAGVQSLSGHETKPEEVTMRQDAPAVAGNGVEVIEGKDVTLSFDSRRCIHARFCVTGAPKTFLANVKGDWLFPDETDAGLLSAIAFACPSGAIQVDQRGGAKNEAAPQVNTVTLRENGPLGFRAALSIDGKPDGYRATLCRCGKSASKPYCDGSHVAAAFQATGEPFTKSIDEISPRNGTLEVKPQHDGPLVVSGPLEICAGTGRVIDRINSVRLCRCGASGNKPYCDGSHARIGFRSGN
jgi:CDGSH-type Zn-finger protein/uncharacterized Fe-S cluster protein YjdI